MFDLSQLRFIMGVVLSLIAASLKQFVLPQLRFGITHLEISVKCTATYLKVLGHFQCEIKLGKSLTAQLKHSK